MLDSLFIKVAGGLVIVGLDIVREMQLIACCIPVQPLRHTHLDATDIVRFTRLEHIEDILHITLG